jgi:hypothetical protein
MLAVSCLILSSCLTAGCIRQGSGPSPYLGDVDLIVSDIASLFVGLNIAEL